MNTSTKWVILSPHLDDAVLSCGGLIAALIPEIKVEIWTLFCGAPFCGPYSQTARWLHSISGGVTGSRLARLRRREDIEACKVLGIAHRHFRWRDAVYRKGRDGKFLYSQCKQETWRADDEALISEIAATLRDELSHEDQLLIPLGVGKHIDHLIVRQAAEKSGHASQAFYAEVPYTQLYPDQITASVASLQSVRYAVSPDHTKQWIKAVQCYASQWRMLEEAAGPLPQLIDRYATSSQLRLYHLALKPLESFSGLTFQSPDRLVVGGKAG